MRCVKALANTRAGLREILTSERYLGVLLTAFKFVDILDQKLILEIFTFMFYVNHTEGHTLVITKEPAEGILDLSPEGAAALIRTTQKVAKAVKKGLACPGVMLVQLNGEAAGQSIPHIHFHILPRAGGLDLKLHGRAMVDARTLEPIAAKIRAAL